MVKKYLESHDHKLQRHAESTFAYRGNRTGAVPTSPAPYNTEEQRPLVSTKEQAIIGKEAKLEKTDQITASLAKNLVQGKGNQMTMSAMSEHFLMNLVKRAIISAKPLTAIFRPPSCIIETSIEAPNERSMFSVWSRVASRSVTVVVPGVLSAASRTADFTCADGIGRS